MTDAAENRLLIAVLAAPVVFLVIWLAWANVWNRWLPPSWKYPRELREAKALAKKVEQFQETKGRLPSAPELGGRLDSDGVGAGDVDELHYVPDPNTDTYRIEYYSLKDERSYKLACDAGHCQFE